MRQVTDPESKRRLESSWPREQTYLKTYHRQGYGQTEDKGVQTWLWASGGKKSQGFVKPTKDGTGRQTRDEASATAIVSTVCALVTAVASGFHPGPQCSTCQPIRSNRYSVPNPSRGSPFHWAPNPTPYNGSWSPSWSPPPAPSSPAWEPTLLPPLPATRTDLATPGKSVPSALKFLVR